MTSGLLMLTAFIIHLYILIKWNAEAKNNDTDLSYLGEMIAASVKKNTDDNVPCALSLLYKTSYLLILGYYIHRYDPVPDNCLHKVKNNGAETFAN